MMLQFTFYYSDYNLPGVKMIFFVIIIMLSYTECVGRLTLY